MNHFVQNRCSFFRMIAMQQAKIFFPELFFSMQLLSLLTTIHQAESII